MFSVATTVNPPETPVEVRTDNSGNEIVITAEVAVSLELLTDPGALLEAAFSDPGAALEAFGNVGADMSSEERDESTDAVVATVIAAGAAINAVGAATAGAASSTGGSAPSSPGGSGGTGGRSAGIYTGLTPGSTVAVRVANKGFGGTGTAGVSGNIGANLSNTAGNAGTSGNGNTLLGPFIYATSGTAGGGGPQVTLLISLGGQGTNSQASGTFGTSGTGSGGTFNGSTNLIFWFNNAIGNAGGQGFLGGSSSAGKSSSAAVFPGGNGGDGQDGIVVIEY